MRTSRISKETAEIISALSPSKLGTRRQTRSAVASVRSFQASVAQGGQLIATERSAKIETGSGDESELSSAASSDIEDLWAADSNPRKRRRIGLRDSPASTTITTTTTVSSRTSPRKVKKEQDALESPLAKERKQRKPARKALSPLGAVTIHPPSNWQEIYTTVQAMRKLHLAPVDTMGCETLAEEHLTPRDKRFQTLIALMLSSQTKDTTNAIAMRRLQTELPAPGLTLENILEVEPETLNEMIYIVGFHNNKTRYIKRTAEILRNQWNSDIPDSIEGLMSLPGVGPKMAYLCLSAAWGRTEGIGVDVHVHRITNLWGWHKTRNPEETRAMLESWLPKEKWHEINHLLVGFGQTICLPVGRKCGECALAEKGLCKSAVRGAVKRVKRQKIVKEVKGEKEEDDDDDEKRVIFIEEEQEEIVDMPMNEPVNIDDKEGIKLED
ncbi:DNA N-glycosylase and apurinic/apyrimidinic (AP) lyase [Agyrium rufum]|nr:DNA N-glycosylase and apurinic/apyrimidinic (AP) lyase [Agyrium rufum]